MAAVIVDTGDERLVGDHLDSPGLDGLGLDSLGLGSLEVARFGSLGFGILVVGRFDNLVVGRFGSLGSGSLGVGRPDKFLDSLAALLSCIHSSQSCRNCVAPPRIDLGDGDGGT